MNKNVSRLSPDQKDRLKEIELSNGQTVVLSYDKEDKLVGVQIRLTGVEPEEESPRTIEPKEAPEGQGEKVKTASIPPPAPFSKSASTPSVTKQKDAATEEKQVFQKRENQEIGKPFTPPPPPIITEKEKATTPPNINESVKEKHTSKELSSKERYCNKCADKISQSAVFCGHCGVKQ